jgi:cytochrome P450
VSADAPVPFPIGAGVGLAELSGSPHPLLARLREAEPVSWLPALDGWLVTRRDLALGVMRDSETFTVDDPRFSTRRVVGPSMLTLDGADHERHRAPFARAFRLGEVRERLGGLVEDEAERLVAAIAPAGRAELRAEFAGPLAVAVMGHVLGLGAADRGEVLGWYEAIVAAVTAVTSGELVPDAGHRAVGDLRATVERVLDDDGSGSLLAAAAAPDGAAGLERPEVVSNAAVLLFGGVDTTEGAIANAVLHLLSHSEQLELVRADPTRLPGAVEESLRLEPAAGVVDRYATRDVELAGARIAAGDLVSVSIAAANRDPRTFDDPDRFCVTRENAVRHIAFAGGPHVCVGMHLARLEARVALGRLLERLPRLRLDPEHPAPAPVGLVFRKPPALRVVWG